MPAPCGDKTPGFYRRRTPRESPLFQLLEQHFDEFERVIRTVTKSAMVSFGP